jgi:hypothetical protein
MAPSGNCYRMRHDIAQPGTCSKGTVHCSVWLVLGWYRYGMVVPRVRRDQFMALAVSCFRMRHDMALSVRVRMSQEYGSACHV